MALLDAGVMGASAPLLAGFHIFRLNMVLFELVEGACAKLGLVKVWGVLGHFLLGLSDLLPKRLVGLEDVQRLFFGGVLGHIQKVGWQRHVVLPVRLSYEWIIVAGVLGYQQLRGLVSLVQCQQAIVVAALRQGVHGLLDGGLKRSLIEIVVRGY